ncbi:MAG TPA: CotH kinase family protein [Polyangiales bacterium]|nr:CotH kinase family protein [Polyangiales bacterium]
MGSAGSAGKTEVAGAAGSGDVSIGTGNAGRGAAGSGGAGNASAPTSNEVIFDPASFPRFDLDVPPASVAALQSVTGPDDPAQDTYVTATFTYDKGSKNEVVENVGVRLKGDGSFQRFDSKPAFKLKFDEFVKNQRFRGLARLTLNNNNDDQSFLAERLAYDVYRAAGVPAPRCNSASVYVNGAFYGVYTNLESEDKHFLSRWFSDNSGNLYEKNGMQDLSQAAAADFDLETNETANDRTDLNQALTAIDAATTPATFLSDIGGKIDTVKLLKLMAVEGAVNQWDTYSFSIWWPHNFRLYDDPTTSKFVFLPWGHDLSMKPAPYTGRAYIKMFELVHQSDNPNAPISAGLLFQRCLASPTCKAAYKDAVNQVITVYEGLGMQAAAERYYNQIRSQVYADPRKSTEKGPVTNAAFDTAYQSVLTTIKGRVAAMRADVAQQ